jgi:hypothetical protein
MKKSILALSISLISISSYCQKEIKPEEAKDNVGDTVKICAKIFDVKFHENIKGSPTYLYTTEDTANPAVTFVIWGDQRKYFDYKPEKDLKERNVCITGKIENVKDKPTIVIERQSQIDIK